MAVFSPLERRSWTPSMLTETDRGGVSAGYAANDDDRLIDLLLETDVRRYRRDVDQRVDAVLGEIVAADGAERDRRVLCEACTLLRLKATTVAACSSLTFLVAIDVPVFS
jgi:hypothetical protein